MRTYLAPLALPVLLATACVEPAATPVDDSLPPVSGLTPLEDEDPAVGAVRYSLTARASDVKLVKDAAPLQAWTYNGSVPGPLLQARVGDDVTVVLDNDLDEPTTIHWHGMRVPNEMDGVVGGEMQAIEPGASFTYHFTAPDAGTYWFHPHVRAAEQVERGLHGMFVVHEAEADTPDVDAERAFVVDDVSLTNDGDAIAPFGRDMMEVMHGRYGNVLLLNGSDEVPSFTFADGQVERWRFVNTANARTMVLRFPGLVVRQIGADAGLWPQALIEDTTEVVLPSGARADLEVRLAAGAVEGSLVSAVQALDDNDEVVEIEVPLASVTKDDALAASTRAGHQGNPHLTVLDNGSATHTLTISGANVGGGIEFTINGYAWPESEQWSVPQHELQIIEVRNELGMEHPFHLHGDFFQVVSRSGGAGLDDRGWRDTVLLRGQERMKVATTFGNPGMWMIHCHILEHAEAGMMSMVMVEPSDEPAGDHEM
ncbi:MAG: multicopper oxidase family protein [Deltaproteobacteria bacterium]|nr:multicopper oxidase family protein [Deltaproteobacteria bacterium]